MTLKGLSNGNKTFKRITNNDVWDKLESQGTVLKEIHLALGEHLKASKDHKKQVKTDISRLYSWIFGLVIGIVSVAAGVILKFMGLK